MNIKELNKFQLLINYTDYCKVIGIEQDTTKPDWFDIDQMLALSVIYKNMTQTHIFPVDKVMFLHMKDQYKILFIKALAWQMKYVNDNQDLYDNPTQYLVSHTLGTSSTGPLNKTVLDNLLNILSPKAKYYLEQMGWLYKSLVDHYELTQFYDEEVEDDYAKISDVNKALADAEQYADLGDQSVKSWVEDSFLQNKEGFGVDKTLVVDSTGEIKWVSGGSGGVTKTYVDQQDAAVLATATERVNDMGSTKLDLPGNAPGTTQPLRLPYYFDKTANASKVTVTAHTVKLDNTSPKVPELFTMDVESATTTTAGLMSAADKTKLDNIDTSKFVTTDTGQTITGHKIFKDTSLHTTFEMGEGMLTVGCNETAGDKRLTVLDASIGGIGYTEDGTTNYILTIPHKSGTIAVTDDLTPYAKTSDMTTALDNKVTKTNSDSQVYATKKESGVVVQTTIGYNNGVSSNSLAQRDNAGRVRVGYANLDDSSNANCATPVSYVKNNFVKLLGDEAYSHGPYHFPYHMTITPAADKVTATAYTITLDNNKSLNNYSFDLPAASTSQAGIMTAADKIALGDKLDASKCTYQTTAPTAAITDGGVHIVYLTSEPTTYHDGYIYLIKETA